MRTSRIPRRILAHLAVLFALGSLSACLPRTPPTEPIPRQRVDLRSQLTLGFPTQSGQSFGSGAEPTLLRNQGPRGTCITLRFPVPWLYAGLFPLPDETDSTCVGVPLALMGQAGEAEEVGTLADNVIEGNRVLGAEGLGIEIVRGSRNRITGNTIRRVVRRDRFPGNSVSFPATWPDANGAGIWVSPGSDENEILGNTFEGVASHAIVLEGDRNRVETRSATDAVRDLGTGNDVRARASTMDPEDEVRAGMDHLIAALNEVRDLGAGNQISGPPAARSRCTRSTASKSCGIRINRSSLIKASAEVRSVRPAPFLGSSEWPGAAPAPEQARCTTRPGRVVHCHLAPSRERGAILR